jgi:pimeloyl-ACP methyl ester carboxylesterase
MARKARNGTIDAEPAEAEVAPSPFAAPRDITYASSDGLKLRARHYGDPVSPWLPVVCLPGLTRNSRDFEDLAVHLSTHRHLPRRVVCFDYRGRGSSAWDKRIEN